MNRRVVLLLVTAAWALWAQAPPDLREAARLDQEGRCREAAVIYGRALSAGAPSPALLNNAGNHYLTCGDIPKAREQYETLRRLAPGHVNANLQLAKLAVAGKQFGEGERYLLALATNDQPEVMAEAGTLYARMGDFRRAQERFQRVAALRPGDFGALWNWGRAAARAGDLVAARKALEAALAARPEDGGVLYELGLTHAASGEFPRAVYLLAQAHKAAPSDAGVALALARAAEGAGYFGDAVLAYERYLTLRPTDDTARRDRARALANTEGRREEGVQDLEAYVRRRPSDPTGHFELAQLCWKAEPERSLALLAEAVRLDPKLAAAQTARGWLLHRLGRDEEALPHLEAARRMTPEAVRVWDQYGLVLQALDRSQEAETAFRKAVALGPADWEARLHLGRVLMEQGRETEAREWLEAYEKLRPARQRNARSEPGMIELATLPAAEARLRELARLTALVKARPDDAVLRQHLERLLLADGRIEAIVKLALSGGLAEAERELTAMMRERPEWSLPRRLHALVVARRNGEMGAGRCGRLEDWLQPACAEGRQ